MCLLTNERYITYQTRFSFRLVGYAPGVGLGGGGGSKIKFFQNSTKFGLVNYSHGWHVQRHNDLVPGALGSGQKVEYH